MAPHGQDFRAEAKSLQTHRLMRARSCFYGFLGLNRATAVIMAMPFHSSMALIRTTTKKYSALQRTFFGSKKNVNHFSDAAPILGSPQNRSTRLSSLG
jgi:hypothetical protein